MNNRAFRLVLMLGLLFVVGTVLLRNRSVKFEIELESAPKDRKKKEDGEDEEEDEGGEEDEGAEKGRVEADEERRA